MRTYNFDNPPSRRGSLCYKWDCGPDELPMWIADMDFETAPCVRQALQRRLDHGIFGYDDMGEAWYEAYIGWWRERHGLSMEKENLIFSAGVVASISSLVRKLTTPNENVLIQTPVYNIFFNSIVNNGCRVLENPLRRQGSVWTMDFADLEEKLADPQTTLMILCNPHNPVGRIWSRGELARIGALCQKHHVLVISDEIHCDLTAPGLGYVPFASVDETCRSVSVTCIAPTKAFNLAGMHSSAVYAADPVLRHKAWRALNTDEVAEPNSFAAPAAVAAFTQGGPWLDALRAYIWANKELVRNFAVRELPGVKVTVSEATYLLWVDVSALTDDVKSFTERLRAETGLWVTPGTAYGRSGEGFFRMNTACPRSSVEDALDRLKRFLRKG
ncbi:MAG: pyridoxal phosphate-dependent aminotransferase [Oscillospiraceae bacterium]|nr:pyridoxal phosphate-dependent aminotransferase [Oscillospiraceae bacterium]